MHNILVLFHVFIIMYNVHHIHFLKETIQYEKIYIIDIFFYIRIEYR